MNTAVTSLPTRVTASAGADFQGWLRHVGAVIWRALEAVGRARAHRELLDFADKCEALQPQLAHELRSACRQGPLS